MSNKIIDEELISSFKMEVSKSMNKGGIRGLSAAIVNKAGPIWLESFGFTDASKQQEVDVNTLFSLQSTTKTVTSVVFLLAVQAGYVGIDDSIVKYYPEFRMKSFYGDDEYKKITFRHLLSHMSSLPREATIGGCFSRKVVELLEDGFFHDNILFTKMDNVVDFFTNIVRNKPEHRAAMPWVFDAVNNGLKLLGNDKEANKILELKKKHLERKK